MPAVTSARANHKGLVAAPISREHNERTALGDLLKSARQRRALTLEQIAAETKIPLRHLQALEFDDEARIAGGFYQRAELRAYSRAVHLDPDLVLAKLSRAQTAASDDVPARAPTHEGTSRQYLVGIGMVAAVVVFGLAAPERETTIGDPARPSPIQPLEQAAAEHEPPPSKPSAPAGQPAPSLAVVTTGRINDQAAEAPTTAETGLLITSEPAGARVTIDGIGWGETPVTVRHLPAGAKRIRVTKEGYHSEERVTRVADGRSATLDISLRSAR